jgi:glycosyltransferase involved in cell wall biosynthesis
MPEVDVLMAVFNGMPYLPEAVESIRGQTLSDWRMVIVNDGSNDGTSRYLDGLRNDSRILVVHQANVGLGPALNRGLQCCESELLARIDSDDVAHPTRLEEQVAYLRHHPQVGLLGSQIVRVGDVRRGSCSRLPCDHESIVADLLRGTSALYHPALICRTELLRQIGGYWNHRLPAEDWDMWLRMAEVTRLANLDRALLSYRFHEGSLSGQSVARTRVAIAYAIDCCRRRRAGIALLDYEEFVAGRRGAPWRTRVAEAVEVYARQQYRMAMGELLGTHPVRGTLRLGWAACWSPGLTVHRLASVWGGP